MHGWGKSYLILTAQTFGEWNYIISNRSDDEFEWLAQEYRKTARSSSSKIVSRNMFFIVHPTFYIVAPDSVYILFRSTKRMCYTVKSVVWVYVIEIKVKFQLTNQLNILFSTPALALCYQMIYKMWNIMLRNKWALPHVSPSLNHTQHRLKTRMFISNAIPSLESPSHFLTLQPVTWLHVSLDIMHKNTCAVVCGFNSSMYRSLCDT